MKRIVIKVGTSNLTYENGRLNLRRLEQLCKVISDLQNQGFEIVFVSSGAIGVGMGKLKIDARPSETRKKQALAAVGQCELMFMYDKFFGEYNQTVAQILLTKYAIETESKRANVINTINTLLDMGIIPIVNENDTVATDELDGANFGDNDMLSAMVAVLIGADRLIILTDIDGLYDDNPRVNLQAHKIDRVIQITDDIMKMAGGSGSSRGTGGMVTKLKAASYVTREGIDCCVMSGEDPFRLYDALENKPIGTIFTGVSGNENC